MSDIPFYSFIRDGALAAAALLAWLTPDPCAPKSNSCRTPTAYDFGFDKVSETQQVMARILFGACRDEDSWRDSHSPNDCEVVPWKF